jgi:hypothetical protein
VASVHALEQSLKEVTSEDFLGQRFWFNIPDAPFSTAIVNDANARGQRIPMDRRSKYKDTTDSSGILGRMRDTSPWFPKRVAKTQTQYLVRVQTFPRSIWCGQLAPDRLPTESSEIKD